MRMMLAENGNLEQFFFHHHRSSPRDQRQGDGRIEIRDVIRHEDVGSARDRFVEADRLHLHARDRTPVNATHMQVL